LNHFCTISTQSHLFKTLALADSLKKFNVHLHVLLVDAKEEPCNTINVSYYTLQFIKSEVGLKLIGKYRKHTDKLRWALKSVFMMHLLDLTNKVIYVDNDTYFFNNPSFLFDLPDKYSILLTPHFYDSNPNKNQNWLEANFKVGLYNAGFIGVNKNAINALQWWSECCLYNIKKSYWRGLFDDQKYLDLVPILFDDVMVLKHKGCNLAGWNYLFYKLNRKENNIVVIEHKYPLVFIHFAETSMIHFAKSDDFFKPEYLTYIAHLRKYNPAFINKRSCLKTYIVSVYINFVKWKISRLLES
jgi:hypothetical protein